MQLETLTVGHNTPSQAQCDGNNDELGPEKLKRSSTKRHELDCLFEATLSRTK